MLLDLFRLHPCSVVSQGQPEKARGGDSSHLDSGELGDAKAEVLQGGRFKAYLGGR